MTTPTPPADYNTSPLAPVGPVAPPTIDTESLPVTSIFQPYKLPPGGLVWNGPRIVPAIHFNNADDAAAGINTPPVFSLPISTGVGRNPWTQTASTAGLAHFNGPSRPQRVRFQLSRDASVAFGFPFIYSPAARATDAGVNEGVLRALQYYSRSSLSDLILNIELWRFDNLIDITDSSSFTWTPPDINFFQRSDSGYRYLNASQARGPASAAGLESNQLPPLGAPVRVGELVRGESMGLPMIAVLKFNNNAGARTFSLEIGGFLLTQSVPATTPEFMTLSSSIHPPYEPDTAPTAPVGPKVPADYPTAPASPQGPQPPAEYDTSPR